MKLTGMISLVIILIGIIGLSCCLKRPMNQLGGEYVHFTHLPLNNSARSQPLGSLDQGTFNPHEGEIQSVRHSSPSRIHAHHAVNTNTTQDQRDATAYTNSYYKDQFDYYPYDWRPFDWRPYWLRRADLAPSARDCAEYAADNCIGLGVSDFQSCYDNAHGNCLRGQI